MPENEPVSLDTLLDHPTVRQITANPSPESIERRSFRPPLCKVFDNPYTVLKSSTRYQFDIHPEARRQLPAIIDNPVQVVAAPESDPKAGSIAYGQSRKIGIVFSGGPAPGGHNVIAGLFDAARRANPQTRIFGFLLGPDGIIENQTIELTAQRVDDFRNLGGFGMIRTGRAKIDTPAKMARARETCLQLGLDALVIVGGDDSNTNAAFLAQALKADGIQVLGVPKTIDGDIQVRDREGYVLCAMSFGFHTAARAFANEVANLCTDSSSDVKYWHICKVMGRVASHLALEVALQTHAHMTLIGEDLANFVDTERLGQHRDRADTDFSAYGITLRHLSRVICDGIVRRAAVGKNYGVIVIPEGVLEFVNEIQVFIVKLNTIIAEYNRTHDTVFHADFTLLADKLEYLRRLARQGREEGVISVWNSRDDDLFNDIPSFFQEGLLTERDSHGNFQFSQVETDKVIMGLVKDYLNVLREKGLYKIGIQRPYADQTLRGQGLDPDAYGPVLFDNYGGGDAYLLTAESIISVKTLKQALVKGGLMTPDQEPPLAVSKLFKQSVPSFKTQTHFYGYDGRGSDPTRFDCNYTYNLGWTVFSLIANNASGQMAAIRNLELSFEEWEPMGIPIASLMHLEERKGRLALVLEKSVVNVNDPAFRVVAAQRERWLAAHPGPDNNRRPGPIRFMGKSTEDRPMTLVLNSLVSRR